MQDPDRIYYTSASKIWQKKRSGWRGETVFSEVGGETVKLACLICKERTVGIIEFNVYSNYKMKHLS